MLSTGTILQNRYRIDSFLSQGGMGAVYRAWHLNLNIPVAIKEMLPQPGIAPKTLAQLRQQFHQEAAVLARLDHPHLVNVTDFFQEQGNVYLVMRFIEGESLAQRIEQQGALPEKEVVTWSDQLLDALACCHNQGVIHRDVKPQNVIIRPDGPAVLVDFGLVKLWDPHDPRTRTAMRGMGTPEYAPPEQYHPDAGHTDVRSDIYGLGATMYHALTGRAPPTATQRIASRHAFQPPRALNQRISPATEAVVLRAMELAVDDRFQSAREMQTALIGAAGRPAGVQAIPAQPAPVARVEKKGIPTLVWGLGAVVAVAVLALLVGVALTLRAGRDRITPTPQAEGTATAPPASPSPTAMDTATVQPATTQPPLPTQQTLTQAQIDAVLEVDNWFCFPGQDKVGVINLPPSFVVQHPLDYIDTHTGRYTVSQVIPVTGGATAKLQGILPRNQCPSSQQAALSEWDKQASSTQSLARKQIDAILGEGNWRCFDDTQYAVEIVNLGSNVVVQYPLTALDSEGIKYGIGQTVPKGGGGTAWLCRSLPIDQCP